VAGVNLTTPSGTLIMPHDGCRCLMTITTIHDHYNEMIPVVMPTVKPFSCLKLSITFMFYTLIYTRLSNVSNAMNGMRAVKHNYTTWRALCSFSSKSSYMSELRLRFTSQAQGRRCTVTTYILVPTLKPIILSWFRPRPTLSQFTDITFKSPVKPVLDLFVNVYPLVSPCSNILDPQVPANNEPNSTK
jgi:hypothetical protein